MVKVTVIAEWRSILSPSTPKPPMPSPLSQVYVNHSKSYSMHTNAEQDQFPYADHTSLDQCATLTIITDAQERVGDSFKRAQAASAFPRKMLTGVFAETLGALSNLMLHIFEVLKVGISKTQELARKGYGDKLAP